MARSVQLVALLLLVCTHSGTVHASVHIWASRPLSSTSPIHLNCFLSTPNDQVTQVNWVIRHTTTNQTTIAVFNPDLGVFIHPSYKEILQLHQESNHNVSVTLTGAEVVKSGTTYCCKFVTFPKGILEECLVMNFSQPTEQLPSLCPLSDWSFGCSRSRIRYIATLLVGAGFLIGIFVLLYCIQKMRHRKSLQLENNELGSSEVRAAPHEAQSRVKQTLPDALLSPFFLMINLEYYSSISEARGTLANTGHTPLPIRSSVYVNMENRLYSL